MRNPLECEHHPTSTTATSSLYYQNDNPLRSIFPGMFDHGLAKSVSVLDAPRMHHRESILEMRLRWFGSCLLGVPSRK